MEEGLNTTGKRLRWAIEHFGPRPRGRSGAKGSIRQFSKALEGKELHGYGKSYQMVHRYLGDETSPPERFLRVAAEVLSPVRYEWLATGKGHPTEAHARAADASTQSLSLAIKNLKMEMLPITLENSVRQEMGLEDRGLRWLLHTPFWVAPLAEVWKDLSNSPGIQFKTLAFREWFSARDGDLLKEALSAGRLPETLISEALAAPLSAFHLDPTVMYESGILDRYIGAMVPILFMLADERTRQDRMDHEWIAAAGDRRLLARGKPREEGVTARGDVSPTASPEQLKADEPSQEEE